MTGFDWAHSQREVYIQQHGSEPYWIALVDHDGYATGTRPTRPEETATGQELIGKLRWRYSWFIERFDALNPEERRAQHESFRRDIEHETERERADSTPTHRRRLERIFAAEQLVATAALARMLRPIPAETPDRGATITAAPRAKGTLALKLSRRDDVVNVTSSRLHGVSFWRIQFLRGRDVLGSDTHHGTTLTCKRLLVDGLAGAKRVRVEARADGAVVATAEAVIPRNRRSRS